MNATKKEQAPLVFKKSEHNISFDEVDDDALKIIRRLHRHGYAGYVVGGGVRDLLLSKTPKDFDIATDATPKQIKALFRNCRIIGRRFKLAHIFFRGNKIIEVSTFRDSHSEEEPTDDPDLLITRDNIFGTVHTDSVRRDLTINALFYDPIQQTIIDHVGGMKDLKSGVVRIIGTPEVRFAEDPVRMIRALRHAARAGFKIDPKCSESIVENHQLIEQCSTMRLYEELKKDFESGSLVTILQLLREYRLLEHFLPYLNDKKYAHFWEPGSYFVDSLLRVDKTFSNGGESAVSAILSLFTLFFVFPNLSSEVLLEDRLTQQYLKDVLDEAFCSLAVPRKEKERINLLIRDLQQSLAVELGQAKKKSRRRSAARDSLQHDKSYLNYFLGFSDSIDSGADQSSKRNRSTSRSRRRRPRRSSKSRKRSSS